MMSGARRPSRSTLGAAPARRPRAAGAASTMLTAYGRGLSVQVVNTLPPKTASRAPGHGRKGVLRPMSALALLLWCGPTRPAMEPRAARAAATKPGRAPRGYPNWDPVGCVWLNDEGDSPPSQEERKQMKRAREAAKRRAEQLARTTRVAAADPTRARRPPFSLFLLHSCVPAARGRGYSRAFAPCARRHQDHLRDGGRVAGAHPAMSPTPP